MLVLLALPALSLLFLQNRQVQTRMSLFVAERLSEELQANISLSSVNYSFFRRVQVRDLYVEDLYGDTLLYAGLTKLHIKQFKPEHKGLTIKKIIVEDAYFNLVIDSSSVVNLKFITDKLKKPHIPPEQKSRIRIASIELVDSRFSLSRMGHTHGAIPVDFNDFHLDNLQIRVSNLETYQDTVRMEVISLKGREHSGLDFHHINTLLSIGKRHLHFYDMILKTGGSDLDIPLLTFDFESYDRFKKFSTQVDLGFSSRQSYLKMEDLFSFIPGTASVFDQVSIGGDISGKLSDLNGDDLVITFDRQSSLVFDFMMIGLPDFNNTFLDFNFRNLNTSVKAINNLAGTQGDALAQFQYPWTNFGNLDFRGYFTGYPDQFVASGLLDTDMGQMVMDLSFEPDNHRGVDFLGRLRTKDFRLGEFLEQERDLDQLDMDVFAEGNLFNGEIRADLEGTIDTLGLYNYSYSNITLDGTFTNNTFDGGFSISDPNIKMDFLGRTDFSGEVPVHRFTADVARARPYFLNLPQSDPNYFISFLIETDLSGRRIDELNGELKLVNSLFEKTDAQLQLYDITVAARNTPEASLIRVRSDQVDIDVTGQYNLSTLPRSFKNLADHYLNVVPYTDPYRDTSNYFVYEVDVKRINPMLSFFIPDASIGDNSSLSGTYDPMNANVQMQGLFPSLEIAGNGWYNVESYARSGPDLLEAGYSADSMTFGKSYSLQNQVIKFDAAGDTAHMTLCWENDTTPVFSGEISLNGAFQPDSTEDRGFLIDLDPGSVVINDMTWDVGSANMLLRKGSLHVDSFEVKSIDKHILADGTISSGEGDDFLVEVENLNLAEIPELTGSNVELEGEVTGFVRYKRADEIPVLLTSLRVDSLWFNQQFMGKTDVDARWDEAMGSINIDMQSEVDGERVAETSGTFVPETQALDFDINLNSFSLASLDPYTEGIAHDMEGVARVNLTLDGTLKAPELNGSIAFDEGAATLDFLNTRYVFNDRVRIYHNNFFLENFMVADQFGNSARINGSVANVHLKDFYISLNIDATNMHCMNTQSADNEVFYGTIFATGNVGINGPTGNLRLKINGTTEQNTALFLPLYNASEVVTSDFITFISEEDENPDELATKKKIGGIQMDLEVDVTNDAVVQLIFDPKVGDIIETSGNGQLRMLLDQSSGFRMFGDVVLEKGDYLFTLQNVINKRFKIEPGGKISFNGEPLDASLDLEAIYATRAAPYNLYPDHDDQTSESLKKRIPVECHLILQGALGTPTIATGISMPTADAETRNLLENSTSTDEELMKQFLSLLVINNFYSVTGYGVENAGGMNSSAIAGVTASELLSNQLSNWLSQISDDFDIGINYRPRDEVTSDEVEMAISTQLLNNRVIISGNVDVGGTETNPSQDETNPYIMGDFDVEFRWTDNVSIIAFNRSRDELLFETAPYKQGIGISYSEEFDHIGQLMSRYREGLRNRKKRRKKPSAPESDE
ncbi:MAG: translocation/assembly module TamB domain-containing protein [Bacteroidota bacterium]